MLRILTQVTIDTNLTPEHTIVSFLPSFRLALLSSTHQFHTKGPLLSSPQNPSILHQKPLSSTPKAPGFNTSLSSTPKTPLSHTENLSVQHTPQFHTKRWVELRGFRCVTEGVLVLNSGVFGVELRDFDVELRDFWVLKRCDPCVEPLCWTEVVCVELRGTYFRPIWCFKCSRMLSLLKSCQFVKFHIVL